MGNGYVGKHWWNQWYFICLEPKSTQVKSNQLKSTQLNSSGHKSVQINTIQPKSSQINSKQLKPTQLSSNQLKSPHIDSIRTTFPLVFCMFPHRGRHNIISHQKRTSSQKQLCFPWESHNSYTNGKQMQIKGLPCNPRRWKSFMKPMVFHMFCIQISQVHLQYLK